MNYLENETQSLIKNVAYEASAFWVMDNVLNAGIYLSSDNLISHWIKMGVMYEVITQTIKMVLKGRSDLQDGDYITVVDNIFFNSVMWAVLETTGIAVQVMNIRNMVPLPSSVAEPVIHAGIKISILRLREYAERLGIPFVNMATHPLKTIYGN